MKKGCDPCLAFRENSPRSLAKFGDLSPGAAVLPGTMQGDPSAFENGDVEKPAEFANLVTLNFA